MIICGLCLVLYDHKVNCKARDSTLSGQGETTGKESQQERTDSRKGETAVKERQQEKEM